MSPQFKNKAEAREAIADVEARASWHERSLPRLRYGSTVRTESLTVISDSRAEAARITALLPTLPE